MINFIQGRMQECRLIRVPTLYKVDITGTLRNAKIMTSEKENPYHRLNRALDF